uniref:Uncharacterized protein n=1 Tax=Cacopsylla melanoneura TaxID=428564 RepID=A0A8D8VK38_9HEMI
MFVSPSCLFCFNSCQIFFLLFLQSFYRGDVISLSSFNKLGRINIGSDKVLFSMSFCFFRFHLYLLLRSSFEFTMKSMSNPLLHENNQTFSEMKLIETSI